MKGGLDLGIIIVVSILILLALLGNIRKYTFDELLLIPGKFLANPISFFLGLGIIFIGLIILGYILWLWAFINALKHRDTLWIVLLILSFFTCIFPGLMAILYYFIVFRGENKKK